jgi:YesN/AraC family two-component response regulator
MDFDSSAGDSKVYKVILIDSDETILSGLSYKLDWERHMCKLVATARDAYEGIRLIEAHEPNILLTDISLPDRNGLAMLAGLLPGFPDMQVTVLTRRRDFDSAREALRLGVARYLLKPAKSAELEEALAAMVGKLRRLAVPVPQEAEDDSGGFIVRKATAFIEENCEKKLSLADAAEACSVSPWHLSKLFGKTGNQSFYNILNRARIYRAKRLLDDPSLRVGVIAKRVGYGDISHFSRVFKKVVGISANEYRNLENRE